MAESVQPSVVKGKMKSNHFLPILVPISVLAMYVIYSSFSLSAPGPRLENGITDRWNQSKPNASKVSDSPFVSINEYVEHSLAQDDRRILDYIRKNGYLLPPSNHSYNLKHPESNPSMGQATAVKQILGNMRNGFFVECGALDGETRSNTLDLELRYGWTGLLIEGDPKNFKEVKAKGRNAWMSPACLATNVSPHQVVFKQAFNVGKILSSYDKMGEERKKGTVVAQCFPIYSLLAAMGVRTVDYFSLDVEGHEFEVLKTIPWEKVLIRVLSVEFTHVSTESTKELPKYMATKGYRLVTKVTHRASLANDFIFAHKSVAFARTLPEIKNKIPTK